VTQLTKSWASGEKGNEAVDKLRSQIAELERRQEDLVSRNGRKLFDWASFAMGSSVAPNSVKDLRDHPASREVMETIALYEQLSQQLLDKQAMLNEKLDEQTRRPAANESPSVTARCPRVSTPRRLTCSSSCISSQPGPYFWLCGLVTQRSR
jgi:protein subunit release factor A